MSGIDRDKLRVKATGEVFTPTPLVQEMLEQLPANVFTDPSKTFLDNSCGDGQFLSEVLIKKMENGIDFETALSTIYGVDLMPDNVQLCRDRLLCGQEHLRHIVNKNIVCHDALTYDYSFNGQEDATGMALTDADIFKKNSLLQVIGGPAVKPQKKQPKKSAVVDPDVLATFF
jgi:type I restriction-modification system DNA methylase subunit